MKTAEVRQRFLDFFASRGHTVVASSPLVPDDPTLLFTNAGMVQFKDTFLGLEDRAYRCATSAQKCMRVSGKHNDLENVGPSPRHHTFFEMLGNFSFGDYFKQEAIAYGWTFMTEEMGVPAARLIVTVFKDDEEAYRAWTKDIGFGPERVLRMGEKTNFWMMADVGPCGPTTEIHYDFGPGHCTCGRPDCSVALDNDCGRWLEVWNIVFMQYDQADDGTRAPLPRTGVDTGMGLERMSAIMQDVYGTYEIDVFGPMLDEVQRLLGHSETQRREQVTGYRVLADHGRAMAFLIADGVLPGNDGRNYVLRLIMRRAMRFGRLLGFQEPFMVQVADRAIDTMGSAYPELVKQADWIREVIAEEEARFERTLESGLAILAETIADVKGDGAAVIPGGEVFRLYDTYGFPPDLTQMVAQEHELTIDRPGFELAMAKQRERARAGGTFVTETVSRAYRRMVLPNMEFLGYETVEAEGCVCALRADGEKVDAVAAERAGGGGEVEIVLDRTPFYAEAGGQVGDTGLLRGPAGSVRITNTVAPVAGVIVHRGVVEEGALAVGETVLASVDQDRRLDIMRNHTVTHLLHRALQDVLGEHAQQRGSLVAPDRMRFDFAHLRALANEELDAVEQAVNRWVRQDAPVSWQIMPLEDARRDGAMMLFGEKYTDTVRVVSVEGVSRELCGGTHLDRTGKIGLFVITQETSVGAGLRRIEGLTGRGAERFVRERLQLLDQLAERLGTPTVEGAAERVAELQKRVRRLARELEHAQAKLAGQQAAGLTAAVVEVSGVRVLAVRVEAPDVEALRGQVDALRDRLGSAVIVLGAVIDGSPRLVAAVTDDLVARGMHAGDLVQEVAKAVGGGGGGRPHLAEAGGRDGTALDAALAGVPVLVEQVVQPDAL